MAVSRRLTFAGLAVFAAAGTVLALAVPSASAESVTRTAVASASAVPAGGSTVTVTEGDAQARITLVIGQTLVVSLPANFRPPTVAPDGVLAQRSVVGGYPTGRPLVARFVAVAPGHVIVSTVTDAQCLHTTPRCAIPQRLWAVDVTVTA